MKSVLERRGHCRHGCRGTCEMGMPLCPFVPTIRENKDRNIQLGHFLGTTWIRRLLRGKERLRLWESTGPEEINDKVGKKQGSRI